MNHIQEPGLQPEAQAQQFLESGYGVLRMVPASQIAVEAGESIGQLRPHVLLGRQEKSTQCQVEIRLRVKEGLQVMEKPDGKPLIVRIGKIGCRGFQAMVQVPEPNRSSASPNRCLSVQPFAAIRIPGFPLSA